MDKEWVDFGTLLSASPEERKCQLSVTNGHDKPRLCLEHTNQNGIAYPLING